MCDLEQFVDDLKEAILNFRLDLCCFLFSVRAGILLCGYFNVISSMICLIAVSTGVLPPLLMNTQQAFMDGEYIKSTCAFAYSSDICLAVLLLCAMYRKDLVLLRYYTYCGLAMLASTLLVYSMVIGILSVLHTFLLVVSLTYQVYLILLVRSVMVELKHESEKQENYYTKYPIYWKLNDIEAADRRPVEAYEMHELGSNRKTVEIIPATGMPKRRASEPVNTTVPMTSKQIKETIEPITTGPVQSKLAENTSELKTNETVDQPTTSEPVSDSVERKATEPVKDNAIPTTSKAIKDTTKPVTVTDTIQLKTGETEKVDTKLESYEKTKAMRFPYKFIAIKIPKEDTIKEEKENEDREKETSKDITKSETKEETKEETKGETKEETKEAKKRKRSIFGRKIKSKFEDGTMKDPETKN